jgi:hypothetical protein
MKPKSKKTLVFLLLAPFLAGILTYVSITVLKNTIGVDISDIQWDYGENEGFQLVSSPYALKASAVYDPSVRLASGNNLIWKVTNSDDSTAAHAEVETASDGSFGLKTLSIGSVEVTCQNEKGTRSKHFSADIYDQGYIRINPKIPSSGRSSSSLRRYGQYDMSYDSLSGPLSGVNATIPLTIQASFEGSDANFILKSHSENVSYANGVITILSGGDSELVFALEEHPYIEKSFAFTAISDGYNVYTYDDLLKGTNYSPDGEILCLQKNFDSLENTYEKTNGAYTNKLLHEDTVLFGRYDFAKQACDFSKDYYSFPTTYSHTFLDTYNAAKGTTLSTAIKAGLHLQKSCYGNGFLINEHELCYPTHGTVDTSGLITPDPKQDYFLGPLPFLSIGAPDKPIIEAYGQDNCGVYLDGDDITLDDIQLRNCNSTIDNLYDLSYVGTVLDVEGKNNTISHANLSYGRSIVRAYSSNGLTLSHDLLSTSREFLMHAGSNTIQTPNTHQNVEIPYGSTTIKTSFADFYDSLDGREKDADGILTNFTMNGSGSNGVSGSLTTMNALQSYLDNTASYLSNGVTAFEDEITLDSVYFHQSGLFSIALDSAFNGPYLYNGLPSIISTKLPASLNLVTPKLVGGSSAPVRITLKGDTRFYDWKDTDTVDASALVANNISSLSSSLSITTDNFFPMKPLLKEQASLKKMIYTYENKDYLNTMVAYYGGGVNLSTILDQRSAPKDPFGEKLEVSFLKASLEGKYLPDNAYVKILARCVNLATGFHPFNFICNSPVDSSTPAYFGETPSFEDLRKS